MCENKFGKVCRKAKLQYGPEIDIWSAGCIFAELLTGYPLFGKDNEIDALYAICKMCGSPNPDEWPEVVNLSGWQACRKEFKQNRLKATLLQLINDRRKVWPAWASCT
jgi:serine/threonine protein kinase